MNLIKNTRDPSFLLLYSPQSFYKNNLVKPEGSLGLLYIAGALRDANFNVDVLDCCVGNKTHALQQTFLRQTPINDEMIRVGLSATLIVKEAAKHDVIGISSIFTPQTRMVEETVKLISTAFPEKLIVLGGINARTQIPRFLNAGADIVCISEAEETIVEIGNVLRKDGNDFSSISGIAFKQGDEIKVNPAGLIEPDLDNLPIPAWDMLELERYWEINRPHNSGLTFDVAPRYAPAMTSRGCPYVCSFCHISGEGKNSDTGYLGKYRYKSLLRVEEEMLKLKDLGVQYVFIEDDSLLAKKERALEIFRMLIKFGFKLGDVNGVNLSHLHKKEAGKLVVDDEMLETMAEAGFNKLLFPVEAGSQRIIDKWASGKISHENYNISDLIKKARSLGIDVASCYLVGYPDETYEELIQTFMCAKRHIEDGSNYVNFTMVTPFPGTYLYDYVVQHDLLLPGIELDNMTWTKPSMKTIIEPLFLEFFVKKSWEYLNKQENITAVREMLPKP